MLPGWSTLISPEDQLCCSATFTVDESYGTNIPESKWVSFWCCEPNCRQKACLQTESSVPVFLWPLFFQNTSCSGTGIPRVHSLWERCCLTKKTNYIAWLVSTLPEREYFKLFEALSWLFKATQGELHGPQSAGPVSACLFPSTAEVPLHEQGNHR